MPGEGGTRYHRDKGDPARQCSQSLEKPASSSVTPLEPRERSTLLVQHLGATPASVREQDDRPAILVGKSEETGEIAGTVAAPVVRVVRG